MDKIINMIKNDQYVSLETLDKEKVTIRKLKSEAYLVSKTNDHLAKKIFRQLIEYNNNDFPSWYILFSLCVKRGEYQEAVQVVDELMRSSEYRQDNLVYLLLLDYIVELPMHLRMELDNITFDDIEVKDSDIRFNVENQNKVRELILQNRFGLAIHTFKSQKEFNSQEKVIKKLLHKVLVQYDWVSFYNEKRDYQSLYEYYLGMDNLTEDDKRTQELAYNADIVTNEGYLSKDFKIDKNSDKGIHEDIKDYIKMVNGANLEIAYTKGMHASLNELIYDVYYMIESKDIDPAIDRIFDYLNRINRSEFIPFIENVFFLSLRRKGNDILYDALLNISMPIVNLDIEYFKMCFYSKIKAHKLEEANEYLELLNSLPEYCLGGICLDYLNYVYNDNMYRFRKVSYVGQEHDQQIRTATEEGVEKLRTSRDIFMLELNSYADTKKVKRHINKYVKYRFLNDGSKYLLIVARRKLEDFDKESVLRLVGEYLSSNQYKKAINIAYQALACSDEFDVDILETIAKIFDAMGRKYMASKYRRIKDLIIKNDLVLEGTSDEEEFIFDSDTDYMLPNIPEITSFIKKHKNLYLVQEEFVLDDEDLVFSLVTIARELYREKNFKLADKLMSFVRSHEYKSDELTRFINEVNSNKKFYQYREKETIVDFTKKLIK